MNPVVMLELRPDYRMSTLIADARLLRGPGGIAGLNEAFEAGVRTFDIGDLKTGGHAVTGAFLEDLRLQRGLGVAGELGIHAQMIPDPQSGADVDLGRMETLVDRTLMRLGVEQLDLVQLHWPDYEHPGCLDALAHLNLLQARGKIRLIGLVDFDLEHVRMFVRAGIDIAAVTVRYSLIDRRPAGAFSDFCHRNDVAMIAADVLAGGFLSDRWLGATDPGPASDGGALGGQRRIIEAFGGWALLQDLLLALRSIATRHGTTIADIAFRAIHDHADPAAVMLDADQAGPAVARIEARDFVPTERDREVLAAVLERRTGPDGPVFGIERERTGKRVTFARTDLKAGHG